MPLKKDDEALWKHVPPQGAHGYAGPRVRLLNSPVNGRVNIAATTKQGVEVKVNVSVRNLSEIVDG